MDFSLADLRFSFRGDALVLGTYQFCFLMSIIEAPPDGFRETVSRLIKIRYVRLATISRNCFETVSLGFSFGFESDS